MGRMLYFFSLNATSTARVGGTQLHGFFWTEASVVTQRFCFHEIASYTPLSGCDIMGLLR